MKVGDKVICIKYYFGMCSGGIAYFWCKNTYIISSVHIQGVNIKDDQGRELFFGYYKSQGMFKEHFITLSEWRNLKIDEILE